MLRVWVLLFFLIAASGSVLRGQTPRVLLVGDSWADFMWADRSIRDLFIDHGHAEALEKGDLTAISGSTAAEWTSPARLQLIADELAANPEIDMVQLTLGGNDFLNGQSGGGWYLGMTELEESAFIAQVKDDIFTVVQHILGLDPKLEILLSFYDYPNFRESLNGLLFLFCNSYWNDLGQPSPLQINEVFQRFSEEMSEWAGPMARVFVVDHMGTMQYHFGYPSEGIAPGSLLPPGDPSLPSPPQAMRFGGNDCIHVSAEGHAAIAERLWQGFYQYRFCTSDQDWASNLASWPNPAVDRLVVQSNQRCD